MWQWQRYLGCLYEIYWYINFTKNHGCHGWYISPSLTLPGLNVVMMTSLNGNIVRVTGTLWGVTGGFPSQRPVTRSFDVFFVLRLKKRLGKQSGQRWSETPCGSLWRHCNGCIMWLHGDTCIFLWRSWHSVMMHYNPKEKVFWIVIYQTNGTTFS